MICRDPFLGSFQNPYKFFSDPFQSALDFLLTDQKRFRLHMIKPFRILGNRCISPRSDLAQDLRYHAVILTAV